MTEVRFTLPLLVMTISGIMLLAAGWLAAYAYLKNEFDYTRALAVEARAVAMKNQDALYDVERRTITLEGLTTRMGQDVAEMRLRQLPKRR